VREPLPLSDADFAEVRAAVMARISRRRTPAGWYFAFAASVVVAVLSIVTARQPIVMPRASHHPLVIPSVARDLGVREAHRPPTLMVRSAHHDKRPAAVVARIEIHTADPDVRIIWITNQEAP
jgi:hypothetical protein